MFMTSQLIGFGAGGPSGNDKNTILLYHFDGADASTTITDSAYGHSAAHNGTANDNAQIDTAQFKFGGSSLLLDGTNDNVSTADHADFDIGTGDVTIDMWLRTSSLATSEHLFDWRNAGGAPVLYAYVATDGSVLCKTPGTTLNAAAATISTNTWQHFAFVRSGTTIYLFIDGVQKDSNTDANSLTATNTLWWGAQYGGTNNEWTGWLDEIRVSNSARWTAGFQVPTEAYG